MILTPPSGYIEICNYSISDYTERNSKEGKILKNAFKNSPSPAINSKGTILVTLSENGTSDTNTAGNESESNTDNENQNESYSIFEASLSANVFNEDDEQSTAEFTPGDDLYIRSLLKDEGCTIWHIQLDDKVDTNKIIPLLKSGKFSTAYGIASKSVKSDGLVVLSATTYLNSQADCNCPFIGFCNYALDVGGEEGSEDESICLAVAPLDGRTGKPREDIVYKSMYNVVGDLIDSKTNGTDDSDDSDGTPLSKWLHKQQNCVGNKDMFANYLKLRKFINDKVSKNLIEYDQNESDNVKQFATNSSVKQSLIFY